MGITFKENCPDIRNTKVVDIYSTLRPYTDQITVFDPWADPDRVKREYGIDIVSTLPGEKFDVVIHAVAHRAFGEVDIRSLLKDGGVVYDVKGALPKSVVDARL